MWNKDIMYLNVYTRIIIIMIILMKKQFESKFHSARQKNIFWHLKHADKWVLGNYWRQIIFFTVPLSKIIFFNKSEQGNFFRKKPKPPPPQNIKWTLPKGFCHWNIGMSQISSFFLEYDNMNCTQWHFVNFRSLNINNPLHISHYLQKSVGHYNLPRTLTSSITLTVQ